MFLERPGGPKPFGRIRLRGTPLWADLALFAIVGLLFLPILPSGQASSPPPTTHSVLGLPPPEGSTVLAPHRTLVASDRGYLRPAPGPRVDVAAAWAFPRSFL